MDLRPLHRPTLGVLAALAFLVLPATTRADVLVVSPPGQGGDHAQIADAVLAAADGDVILVRAGTYSAPVLADDKGVSVQAEAGVTPRLGGSLNVRNLAAGKTFSWRGVELRPFFGADPLVVDDNEGHVRFEDALIQTNAEQGNGATVRRSGSVSFLRCDLRGAPGLNSCTDCPGTWPPLPGGGGAFLRLSSVAFYDCFLRGGQGGSDVELEGAFGARGGPGLEVVGGRVHLSGCALTGGGGGQGGCEFTLAFGYLYCSEGGDGGAALWARGDAKITRLDTLLLPGGGGAGGECGTCGIPPAGPGQQGLAQQLEGTASTSRITTVRRGLTATSPVREGGAVTFVYEGVEGDAVALWGSLSGGWVFLPEHAGVFLQGFPLVQNVGVPLGVAGPGGLLVVDVPVGELGPGVEGFAAFLQASYVPLSTGVLGLGPSGAVVLLDGAL